MGSPSSIHRLPGSVKERLDERLRDPGVTQREATAAANEELAAEGAGPISKSAVNRYAIRMERVGRRVRQSREVADAWIGKLGSLPGGQVGHITTEIVRTLAFEVGLLMQEDELDRDSLPQVLPSLRSLALTLQRLERTSEVSERRERQIRAEAAAEMKAALEREADGPKGVSVDRLREIVSEVYGL